MINLNTGLPGHGKTLFVLCEVKARAERESRPVYYHGIKDLKLNWNELKDPERWYEEAPEGAIIVIDECQTLFRPRGAGTSVPRYVSELETHRHRGYDIYLITQHPMLVDANVRRLTERHQHSVRVFGLARAVVYEWPKCKTNLDGNLSDALSKHEFFYPKESYTWYKSAEVHTVKRRIPMKFIVLLLLLLVGLPLVSYGLYRTISSIWTAPQTLTKTADAPAKSAALPSIDTPVAVDKKRDWNDERVARVAGLPHTAPIYDDITKPARAPLPAACIRSGSRCDCFTQQGTRMSTPQALCEGIVAGGFFVDFEMPEARSSPLSRTEPVASAPSSPPSMSIPDKPQQPRIALSPSSTSAGAGARFFAQH